jgi:GxxExxY protein
MMDTKTFIFKEEGYQIIGACMEVHKQLGYGFLEAVYQEALTIEFERRNIPFETEKEIHIHYKDCLLKKSCRVDLMCYDKIIVELKAVEELSPVHESQLLNYLAATQLQVGYLINFGSLLLQYKRLIK